MKTAQKIGNNSRKENRFAIKGQLIKITYVIFGDNPFM